MPKYYDLEPYEQYTISKQYSDDYSKGWCKAIQRIMADKPLDVQPVRHGKWIKAENPCSSPFDMDDKYICSACGRTDLFAISYNIEGKENRHIYCPYCGAKMDGESNE